MTPDQISKSGTEDSIQAAYFASIRKLPQAKWIHAIPNGGDRNIAVASMLKATGVRSGVWDVCIPFPSHDGRYCMAYIEFKRPKYRNALHGGLSPNQLEFGECMHARGSIRLKVCYDWRSALDFTCEYLGLNNPT